MLKIKLLVIICLFFPTFAVAEIQNPDIVSIYLVPLSDFPEEVSVELAKIMSKDFNVWVKSSLRVGAIDIDKMPGTNQLQAEDILEKHQKIIRNFPETNSKTYFLLLTTSDINSKIGGFRFQFSFHNKDLMTSVVSMARLFNYIDDKPVADNIAVSRLYKMTKRAIGEMYFGWQRSTNIEDVMYSPLMGVHDLDRIGVNHTEKEDKKEKNSPDSTKDKIQGLSI